MSECLFAKIKIRDAGNALKKQQPLSTAIESNLKNAESSILTARQSVAKVAVAIEALKNNQIVKKWESESLSELNSRLMDNLNNLLLRNDLIKLDQTIHKAMDNIKKIEERAGQAEKHDQERLQAVKCTKAVLERLGVPFKIITDKKNGLKSAVIIAVGFGREKRLDIEMGLNGSVKMVPQGAGYGDHSCRLDMKNLIDTLRAEFGIIMEIDSTGPASSGAANANAGQTTTHSESLTERRTL